MLSTIKKQLPRFGESIKHEIGSLRKHETSFAGFGKACSGHLVTLWREITKPPATQERKQAIQYLQVGIKLYNRKRFLDALHAFKRALDIDPKYSRAHLYYGNAQYKLNNPTEAIASWEFAVRVDPESETARKAQDRLDALNTKNKRALHEIKEHLKNA